MTAARLRAGVLKLQRTPPFLIVQKVLRRVPFRPVDIVAYEWFCEREVHYEGAWGYRIDIPEGFVYAYDAYIDPAYRNAGIWLRFKAYLGELMAASGKRGVLTFVDYGNWASLGTHVRFGFKTGASVLAMKVLGWMITLNLDSL